MLGLAAGMDTAPQSLSRLGKMVKRIASGRARRAAWIAATVLATLAVIAARIRDFGGESVAAAARGASPAWVAVAFALASACVLLGALRWSLVLGAMGYRVALGRLLVIMLA